MEEEKQYINNRINQFNDYEKRSQNEYEALKSLYVTSAELLEPILTLVARASIIGLPCAAFLAQMLLAGDKNWLAISGAAVTIIGIVLQIHWTQQGALVTSLHAVESERDNRFSIYYNFRIHPRVIECVQFTPEEDRTILESLHSERLTKMREIRSGLVKDQNKLVLTLLIFGTLLWALA